MSDVKRWEEDNWVEVDLDLCRASGECVNVCPAEVYVIYWWKSKCWKH